MGGACHNITQGNFGPTGRMFWGPGEAVILLKEVLYAYFCLFHCVLS
jgi:hypothetical protein